MSGQQLAVIQPVSGKQIANKPVDRKQVGQIINQFQSDTTELDTAPEPLTARFTLMALALFIVVAITWASFATIDRVVTATGRLVSIAPNIVVQPLESAVIRSIDVRVGDTVKAGQTLATLDQTFTQADVGQLEARLASLDAAIARMEAEQAHVPYVPQSSRFEYGELQKAIWEERRSQFIAQMRLFDERLAHSQATIKSREQEQRHLTERLVVVRDVEGMRNELEKTQTGSRLNSLVAKDTRIEVERNLARTASSIVEARHEMEAIEAEREVYRRQWDSRLIEDLVARRGERDGIAEQLIKARRRQDMVRLESPADAMVLEVAQRSVGSIIKDAEPFFRLVPLNAPLEIEASIEARQLAFIAVGDPVQVKFEALNFQQHGMAEGVVKTISADAFTDNRTTPEAPSGSFYKVRVTLTKTDLRNVPESFQLVPGMPLAAEIKVGHRSVIAYFLRPIVRGMNESLREP